MQGHRETLWKNLADQLGAEFEHLPGVAFDRVVAHSGPWTIVLDGHVIPGYKMQGLNTRLRAPYCNPHNFRFQIHSTGLFGGPGCPSGMKTVKLDDPAFDSKYTAYATHPDKLRKLLANARLRRAIEEQRDFHLAVKESDPSLNIDTFPAGVDELHYETHGEVRNPDTLRAIFEIFTETLRTLHDIGEAGDDSPSQKI